MLKATLTLEGTLEQIERAASLLIAGSKIEALSTKLPTVSEMIEATDLPNEAEKRLMTHVANQDVPAEESEAEPEPAKRKHRKKNNKPEKKAASSSLEETPEAAAPALETPSESTPNGKDNGVLPDLETLKGLVVNAVKSARAGGDGAILSFLPTFKKATKLPFVMEAKDEHRAALLDLLTKAGIAVD
jgi:hypothetical protein